MPSTLNSKRLIVTKYIVWLFSDNNEVATVRNKYTLLGALIGIAAIFCGCDSSSSSSKDSAAMPVSSEVVAELELVPASEQEESILIGRNLDHPGIGGGAGCLGWYPSIVTTNQRRGVRWGKPLDFLNPNRLLVKNDTWSSASLAWTTTYHEFSASFEIEAVCSQSAGVFFLLGWDTRNGAVVHVIERWTLNPEPVLIGSPPNFNMNRKLIYRGVFLGDLDQIEVDPEGRFLMLYSRSDEVLTQMFLPSEATIVLSSAMPDVKSIWRIDHVTNGRMWFCSTEGSHYITTLIDQANDTSFETVSTLDWATWIALDYFGGCTDNFVHQ